MIMANSFPTGQIFHSRKILKSSLDMENDKISNIEDNVGTRNIIKHSKLI